MLERAERTGLAVAVAGHAAIFGALSLGLFAATKPVIAPAPPMDVQIVDLIGPADTSPEQPRVEPAQSVAPVVGTPREAEPPPETPPSVPAPVQRKTVASPAKPAPQPVARPAPAKPAAKPPAPVARGSRLGSDFLKGVSDRPSASTSQTPRSVSVGPAQLAGLAAAIRRQVQPCADRIATPGPGAEKITTKINLRMNRDGSFAATPAVVSQITDEDNARYSGRVGELAKAAFVQCAPFELPTDLYEGWKNINLNYKLPG